MKYVAILILIVVLVRIDSVLRFFDQTYESFKQNRTEMSSTEIKSTGEIVPYTEDKNLIQTPKAVFLSLLHDFHVDPSVQVKTRALEEFKKHPRMFDEKLDKGLEAAIYSWRDLLSQNNREAGYFLIELMNHLKGENLLMLKNFISLWIDINPNVFLEVYSKSKDFSCSIITLFGDTIPEQERINELYDREASLNNYINQEKVDPVLKAYASSCQLTLSAELSKIPKLPETLEDPPAEAVPVQSPETP